MTSVLDDRPTADVIAFTARQSGCHPQKVGLESRLRQDLGVDGDDAAEFFEAFAEEFAVDLGDFRFSHHFGPEGIPLRVGLALAAIAGSVAALLALVSWWAVVIFLAVLILFLVYRFHRAKSSAPATVRVLHLVRAATAGRWVFPYGNL